MGCSIQRSEHTLDANNTTRLRVLAEKTTDRTNVQKERGSLVNANLVFLSFRMHLDRWNGILYSAPPSICICHPVNIVTLRIVLVNFTLDSTIPLP